MAVPEWLVAVRVHVSKPGASAGVDRAQHQGQCCADLLVKVPECQPRGVYGEAAADKVASGNAHPQPLDCCHVHWRAVQQGLQDHQQLGNQRSACRGITLRILGKRSLGAEIT